MPQQLSVVQLFVGHYTRKSLFLDTADAKTYESQKILSTWVSTNYQPEAQAAFFKGADFKLVSFAHAHDHTVVTEEVYAVGSKKVKIPNACEIMNVKVVKSVKMLADEGAIFS